MVMRMSAKKTNMNVTVIHFIMFAVLVLHVHVLCFLFNVM
jgi:hypothetical protein